MRRRTDVFAADAPVALLLVGVQALGDALGQADDHVRLDGPHADDRRSARLRRKRADGDLDVRAPPSELDAQSTAARGKKGDAHRKACEAEPGNHR